MCSGTLYQHTGVCDGTGMYGEELGRGGIGTGRELELYLLHENLSLLCHAVIHRHLCFETSPSEMLYVVFPRQQSS